MTSAGFGKKSCIGQCISVFFNKCALVTAKQLVGYVSNGRVKKSYCMSRRKAKKFKPKVGKKPSKDKAAASGKPMEALELTKRERNFEIFVAASLFAFGLYHSVLYFGHKVVPISDFPAVIGVGRELLSFKLPSNFKTAPVVGLLQACLSYLVGGWLHHL